MQWRSTSSTRLGVTLRRIASFAVAALSVQHNIRRKCPNAVADLAPAICRPIKPTFRQAEQSVRFQQQYTPDQCVHRRTRQGGPVARYLQNCLINDFGYERIMGIDGEKHLPKNA